MKCSSKLEAVHSDIRGPLYVKATEMEKQGIKVLKINSGNPAIFGHTAPDCIKQALIEGADRAVAYCDFRGMPAARASICEYHKGRGIQDICDDDIYIGNGVSELVNISLSVLLNEGDEILVPTPCYSLWSNCALLVGGVPVYYMCDENAGWFPDINDIRKKITSRTKAIVLINPNNPTGALYSKDLLEQIAALAREHDLMIFSDEIYDRLLFDGAVHTPMAAVAPDLFVVTMNGLLYDWFDIDVAADQTLLDGFEQLERCLFQDIQIFRLSVLELCRVIAVVHVCQTVICGSVQN